MKSDISVLSPSMTNAVGWLFHSCIGFGGLCVSGESVSMRSHRSRGRGNVPYVRAITVIALLLPLITLAMSTWHNSSHWYFWRSLPDRPLGKDYTFFKMSTKKWWFLFWPLLWLCDDAGFGAVTPISYPWVHQPCKKANLMRVAAVEKNGKALESWGPH